MTTIQEFKDSLDPMMTSLTLNMLKEGTKINQSIDAFVKGEISKDEFVRSITTTQSMANSTAKEHEQEMLELLNVAVNGLIELVQTES